MDVLYSARDVLCSGGPGTRRVEASAGSVPQEWKHTDDRILTDE